MLFARSLLVHSAGFSFWAFNSGRVFGSCGPVAVLGWLFAPEQASKNAALTINDKKARRSIIDRVYHTIGSRSIIFDNTVF